jgi:hypothetical protein
MLPLAAAMTQARSNARYFRTPYAVYSDTAGNWRACRAGSMPRGVDVEIIHPTLKIGARKVADGWKPCLIVTDEPKERRIYADVVYLDRNNATAHARRMLVDACFGAPV